MTYASYPPSQPPSYPPSAPVRRYFGWGSVMDLIIIGLCVVSLGAGGLAFGTRILAYEAFVVRSGSMEPTIGAGSVVVVEQVPATLLREGDIIAYRRPVRPPVTVTHRIVYLRLNDDPQNPAPLIRTQGDANNLPDPWQIELFGVASRVIFWVPWVGYLYDAAREPVGQLTLVVMPALILTWIVGTTVRGWWRRWAERRRRVATGAVAVPGGWR